MTSNADDAVAMFRQGYNCAQSVLACGGRDLGMPRDLAIRVGQAFGGGIGRTGNLCGALTGALMLVGMQHPAVEATDAAAKAAAHDKAQALLAEFNRRHASQLCRDLTGCDLRTAEGQQRFKETDAHNRVCVKFIRDAVEIIDQLFPPKGDRMNSADKTHQLVQKAYAEVARKQSSCCGDTKAGSISCCDKGAYVVPDHPVPEAELGLSCGNPLAFGHIEPGDIVVDLGSGAGKDVFLAAQKVGDRGKAIGIDMTPEMLKLARNNAVKFFQATGLTNVEFREGKIESLPLEDGAADVVISNCVINLSTDKPRVFREVYRVLKPGGRMIVSDIVLNRPMPAQIKDDAGLYASCIAGALLREEYLQAIRDAGFGQEHVLSLSDKKYNASQAGGDPTTTPVAGLLADLAASITVLARK